MTMSSIFRMSRTHSVASETAEVWTRSGTSTFSSRMFVTLPLRTLMPAAFSPSACLFRSSVTTWMASSPAFSASVYGTTSIASANARTQYECMPSSESAHLESSYESRISGAPPPGVRNRFLTRQRSTQSASCSERCASSTTCVLAPRSTIDEACELGQPEKRTSLSSPIITSSMSSHDPSLTRSGVSKVETMSPSSTSASRSVPSKSECSIDMTPASAKRCSGKL
mmetsp:Transcript_35203/g.105897  ORF Transcript_35203/g.105897 Transcript_35203/m.105897 type:complete len:226 (+) Transcript_35203:168-845(+)